ncbi:MAG: hypothetical protein ACRD5G_03485 [Candidatus Acidiferrales bacterium]
MKRKVLSLGILAFAVAAVAMAQGQVRVYVTDSKSWEVKGGAGVAEGSGGGAVSGGARPQTAEIIKTFNERCPEVVVTMNREKADFVVLLEHEGGKDFIRRDNKVVVTNKEGDVFFTGSTRSLGNAVKDSCKAIRSYRTAQSAADSDGDKQQ